MGCSPTIRPLRQIDHRRTGCSLSTLLAVVLSPKHPTFPSVPAGRKPNLERYLGRKRPSKSINHEPATNHATQFETIYALALPGREDRTQPLLDAANVTNLTLTVLNAVKDTDIDHADYPKGWNEENHRGGELGCLASHVRTWNLYALYDPYIHSQTSP